MKKHLSFLLIFTIIFGMIFCVNVSAVNDDVNVNMGDFFGNDDPFAPKFTVSVEQGKDAGYITESKKGDNFLFTATPYYGNEFLGWYKDDAVY